MSLLEAALAYAGHVPIFPVDIAAKKPLISTGRDHAEHASRDPAQIRAWWAQWPDAGIGMPTGAASGLVVLDADEKHDGERLLALAEQGLGVIPRSLVVRTQHGGLHVYCAHPGEGIRIKSTAGQIVGSGLDVRGDGGIVLLPPTKGYTWIAQGAAPALPVHWLERTRAAARTTSASVEESELPPIAEGGRNDTLFRLGAKLRSQGLSVETVRAALHAENAARIRPPLDASEVDTIASSAGRVAIATDMLADEAVFGGLLEAPAPSVIEAPSLVESVFAEGGAPAIVVAPARTLRAKMADVFGDQAAEVAWPLLLADVADTPADPVQITSTANPQLDALLGGGWRSSGLITLAAPPAAGKTAYVIDQGLRIAHADLTRDVIVFATEIDGAELAARAVANLRGPGTAWSDLVTQRHASGALGREVRAYAPNLYTLAADRMQRDGDKVMQQIAAVVIESTERRGRAPFVIVDYMQHLARGADEMKRGVSRVSDTLRRIALGSGCTMLAISSVSRAIYSTGAKAAGPIMDPRSYMTAIKESGDIDFDSIIVGYLDVGERAEGESERPARIAIAKARGGEVGFAGARFHGASGRWTADSAAVVLLEQVTNAAASSAQQDSDDERAVCERITSAIRMGQGTSADEIIRSVMANTGTQTRARKALARLLASGRVERYAEVGHTEYGGTFTKNAHRVREIAAPAEALPPHNPFV